MPDITGSEIRRRLIVLHRDGCDESLEVEENPHVNLGYSSPHDQQYVSISGTAELIRDERKTEDFCDPKYSDWFPEGVGVSKLGLLKVAVELAEYWDASTSRMVQIADFARTIFDRPPFPSTEHGKNRMGGGREASRTAARNSIKLIYASDQK